MRIRRMELQGFKSFADRTVLTFGPGVSALVGPNGCGKSNVVDALRWALGEQTPSTLRGRGMEDLIFAGAERRPPAGFAEVQVAFDNTDGRFPGPLARFSEVEVGRRLHRNGDSDYRVNRAAVRLKDVTGLFLDSGVGARAYSIIEQGNVGFVISARPEERRVLIDETAGVNRFRVQRVDAEHRMSQTRENLRRVRDVEEELDRQRRSLDLQARKAQSWRDLKRTQREASLRAVVGEGFLRHGELQLAEALAARLLAEADAAELHADVCTAAHEVANETLTVARELDQSLQASRAAVLGQRALAEKERELRAEEERRLRDQQGRRARDAEDAVLRITQLHEEEGRLTKIAEEHRVELSAARDGVAQAQARELRLREEVRGARAALEAGKTAALDALSELTKERNTLAVIRARHGDAVHRQENHLRRVEEAAAQLGAARDSNERIVTGLIEVAERARGLREEFQAGEQQIQRCKQELAQFAQGRDDADLAWRRAHARLESLAQLLATHEGLDDGARAVLKEHLGRTPGVLGLVADLVEVHPDLEKAVGVALAEFLQAVVVQDEGTLSDLACGIESKGLPRTRLVALIVPDHEPVGEALGGQLRDRAAAPGLSRRLFGGVSIADDAVTAVPGQILLGGGGRRVDEFGVVVGSDKGRGASVLARRREARELEIQVASLEGHRNERALTWTTARDRLAAMEAERDTRRRIVHDAEIAELSRRRDAEEANKERRRLEEGVERAEKEREAIRVATEALAQDLRSADTRLPACRERHERAEAAMPALRDRLAELERASDDSGRDHQAIRLAQANAEHALAGVERERSRLGPQRVENERRLERDRAELAAAEARLQFLAEDQQRTEGNRGEADGRIVELTAALEEAASDRKGAETQHRASRTLMAEAVSRRDGLRRPREAAELQVARLASSWDGLGRQAALDHDIVLADAITALIRDGSWEINLRGTEPTAIRLQRDEIASELEIARAAEAVSAIQVRIEALGAVNLGAADELSDAERRLAELAGQRTDLERALADLEDAIRRLEDETAERFRKAFDAVQERFGALYPRLVGGGRAELRLTRPDHLLETGVEIVVEPPGKRLQTLGLLSGGEKAMAAIALVFAVFQVKPSPFCLLDEVDAPLDEANSRRFNDMIRELASETQFLLITHNRTTMEVADVLYGITMQEPGVSSVVAVRLDPGRPDDS